MKLGGIIASAALLIGSSSLAMAEQRGAPAGPVQVIVPYGAGSFSDVLARKIAHELGARNRITISVENIVGAGGVIGTQALARRKPDGNTLGLIASNHVMNAAIQKALTYDPVKSFEPVAHVTFNPFVVAVTAELSAKSLDEYLRAARAQPSLMTYGSAGIGSSPHLAIEKLAHMAGVKLKHVPYRETGQLLNDLLGGRIGMAAYSISPLLNHLKDGKVRAIAVTGKVRSDLLPDVPTVAEAGVAGYDMVSWNGLLVPAGTPAAIVAFYAREIEAIAKDPKFRSEISALGATVEYLGPAEFADRLKLEADYWKKLVQDAGIPVN